MSSCMTGAYIPIALRIARSEPRILRRMTGSRCSCSAGLFVGATSGSTTNRNRSKAAFYSVMANSRKAGSPPYSSAGVNTRLVNS